jgi:hypothetical protein
VIPDSAERDFGPPQLNWCPVVISLRFFPEIIFTTHFTGLESVIDLLLCKWLPNVKFLPYNGKLPSQTAKYRFLFQGDFTTGVYIFQGDRY